MKLKRKPIAEKYAAAIDACTRAERAAGGGPMSGARRVAVPLGGRPVRRVAPPPRLAGAPWPCVVMAHGFSLTRHDGLPAYAERLAAAGAAVLVFDHRYLGDSGGSPRQRFRKAAQMQDWRSAVAFARTLEGVDSERIVLWGFSFSGGHAVETAAADGRVAATLALCPLLDGLWRAPATPPRVSAWLVPRALADEFGRHNLVPVTAQPGGHAAMTLPGEADGFAAVVPEGSPWRNEISPAVFLTVPSTARCHARAMRGPSGSAWVRRTSRSRRRRSSASPRAPPCRARALSVRPLRRLPRRGPDAGGRRSDRVPAQPRSARRSRLAAEPLGCEGARGIAGAFTPAAY